MTRLGTAVQPDSPTFREKARAYQACAEQLNRHLLWASGGGGERMIARHRARKKIFVRDRIDLLLDPGTPFLELSPLAGVGLYGGEAPAAGIVTGIGTISGTVCAIIAQDMTVKGGTFFKETIRKHTRAQEIALEHRLPVVYLVDCGGANLNRMEDVFYDQDQFGGTLYRQCRMSADGIPQLAAVFGECTAGGAYIPALCDEFIMVEGNASIHLGGPQIVRAAISEEVDRDNLGGPHLHSVISGVSDGRVPDEMSAIAALREMVAATCYAQPFGMEPRPVIEPLYDIEEIPGIIGTDLSVPFEQREIVARLLDGSEFHEFKAEWGAALVCGFGHLEGFPVGVIANNGVLFTEESLKGVHFIELCDQRGIPILFLQNTTGFMVGSHAEKQGISKHSAKLVYAVSNARVPKYTLVTAGSYGAGNYGMSGRGFRPRFMFMWPNARLGGMNADVGSSVLMDLRKSSITQGEATEAELAEHERMLRRMFDEKSDPYFCTARVFDDGVIHPRDTRRILGLCLALAGMRPEIRPNRPVYRM